MNISVLKPDQYPFLLQQISPLPPKMYIAGPLPPTEHKYICVIGSRNHSEYGRDVCYKLISGLRGYPVVIVSGLAIGIDSIAHEAALKAGVRTVSFPGSGLSNHVLYPISRRRLAHQIYESGNTLISPFEMNQNGTNWTFPVRNRLMAGISHATLIVEARMHSGTLLTATYAQEFNRDIMAVPGSIFSDLSYGPHMLMSRGAAVINSAEDILENLGFPVARRTSGQSMINFAELSLSPDEKKIMELLAVPMNRDAVIVRSGLPVSRANAVLGNLELRGLIRESGGEMRRE